jgi:hypothetical protein
MISALARGAQVLGGGGQTEAEKENENEDRERWLAAATRAAEFVGR